MPERFRAILEKARGGDTEALGLLLETARLTLLKEADLELASHLRAKEGASDLVQDTFLEAHRQFASFRGDSEPELRAWLRRILEHNLLDAARRYFRAAKRQVGREVCGASVIDRAGNVPAPGSTPSQVASRREAIDGLERAVDRLPYHYRDVVLWRHRDRLSNQEIGRRMGRSEDAVRKLWVRALEMLADELGIDELPP
jgi:RNA polymerase sigma-70 factor (ECF subfamily)